MATQEVAQSVHPLGQPVIRAAAERIAEVRHTWGWRFHQKRAKVMAVDLLMAEAALRVPEIAEALHRAWPGIYPTAALPAEGGRNIISREEWDKLTQKHHALEGQLRHLQLPTQRGYRGKIEKQLNELNRNIRAVDGVIGIDA